MPNELPLPPDLHFLLEKREQSDRRAGDRRADGDAPVINADSDDASDGATDKSGNCRQCSDRRVGDRRNNKNDGA